MAGWSSSLVANTLLNCGYLLAIAPRALSSWEYLESMSEVAPIAAAFSNLFPIFIPKAACPFTGTIANVPKCTNPLSKLPHTVFVSIGFSESTKKSSDLGS